MRLKNNPFLKNVLAAMAGWPMWLIQASWRVQGKLVHPQAESLMQARTPVIYALWHGRMYCLFKAVPLDSVAILVSPSNDGEFITRVARAVGFRHFVRGSHKRGGRQAIVGLIKELTRHQHSIAFTVDGPRGPKCEVKPGIIRLASQTGAPIIPLGAAARHILFFKKSWDHFHGPLPTTAMHLAYGEPLKVPPNLEDAEIDAYAQQLQAELYRINAEADALYGFANGERL